MKTAALSKSNSNPDLQSQEKKEGNFSAVLRLFRTDLSKIYHTYSTMIELGTVVSYLRSKKFKKYINHVTHPMSSEDSSIFSPEISNFCYIKKYRYRLHFNSF